MISGKAEMDKDMFLVVGLGNPGAEYENTRHNIGFRYIDFIAEYYKVSWYNKNKFNAHLSDIFEIGNSKILLCKPQTYMNLSGEAVQTVANFYKIKIDNILVLHDELDIPLAKLLYKFGGGAAGHNGLKSIMNKIGSDFHRIRIGIGRSLLPNQSVADFVLQNFSYSEIDAIYAKMHLIAESLINFFDKGRAKTILN
ncbi:MAG: aminoacyl-tRNA hydrolase [Rickettsiaceae bacterium]|nr:aminoacyl-tRNA hydrolase [Rickettsiaceae bacterium]